MSIKKQFLKTLNPKLNKVLRLLILLKFPYKMGKPEPILLVAVFGVLKPFMKV